MEIKVIHLSEDEKEYYLENGGIYGSELYGKKTSTEEYDKEVEILKSNMLKFGKSGIEKEYTYYIDDYEEPYFFPCIEVSDKKLLSKSLIREVIKSVLAMSPDYRVDICNAWLYINDDFNIIIEGDKIYVYSEKEEYLKLTGLESKVFSLTEQ